MHIIKFANSFCFSGIYFPYAGTLFSTIIKDMNFYTRICRFYLQYNIVISRKIHILSILPTVLPVGMIISNRTRFAIPFGEVTVRPGEKLDGLFFCLFAAIAANRQNTNMIFFIDTLM